MNIYADGIFDVFHNGHIKHLEKIKSLYSNSQLIIGIISDKQANSYKRKPIINEKNRSLMVNMCKYVNRVIIGPPLILDQEFIEKEKIDLVVHAFNDDDDFEKQKPFFKIPIQLGKFKRIEYNKGISSSQIIHDFKPILFNSLPIDNENENELNHIFSHLNINSKHKVLEIGCGNGKSSLFFKDKCDYYGMDIPNNTTLIQKNIMTNLCKVIATDPINTPFKNNYFDKIFCRQFKQMFPNLNIRQNVLKEINRIIRIETSTKPNKQKINNIYLIY